MKDMIESIIRFWFGALDDDTRLNRDTDPFRGYFRRWYGKDPAVDADV